MDPEVHAFVLRLILPTENPGVRPTSFLADSGSFDGSQLSEALVRCAIL